MKRKKIPLFKRGAWGTVYLIRSVKEPNLFKIGYTTRKVNIRKNELKRVGGKDIKIAFSISMHNAYFVEQHVLKGLRKRFLGKGDKRGTEWFRLRKNESLESIVIRINKSVKKIRFIARLKLSWWNKEYIIFDPLNLSK